MSLFLSYQAKSFVVSSAYDGKQMIKPMNDFNVDVACFGNHEFVDLVLCLFLYHIESRFRCPDRTYSRDEIPLADLKRKDKGRSGASCRRQRVLYTGKKRHKGNFNKQYELT